MVLRCGNALGSDWHLHSDWYLHGSDSDSIGNRAMVIGCDALGQGCPHSSDSTGN